MNNKLKRIENEYRNTISNIPISKLGELIYNKQFGYMESLKGSNSKEAQKRWKNIEDILENSDFKHRAYLFHKMHCSLLDFHFKDSEEWHKQTKKDQLLRIINIIFYAEFFKSFSDRLDQYNRTGKKEYLDYIQSDIDHVLKSKEESLKEHYDALSILLDVFTDEKPAIDLYRNPEDMIWLKKDNKKAYDLIVSVYTGDDDLISGFDEVLKDHLIKGLGSVIEDKFFNKHEGSYARAELMESNK